jgi:hypothetical protein
MCPDRLVSHRLVGRTSQQEMLEETHILEAKERNLMLRLLNS